MKKIMFFWTNRAEEGPLRPVIRRLDEDPDILCIAAPRYDDINPVALGVWYTQVYTTLQIQKPDLVFASFDRVQMLPVAMAAMVSNIPVAQIHAGDLAGPGTWDDKVRFAITTIADLVFCNGDESHHFALETKMAMAHMRYNIGDPLGDLNVFEVGSTALDDVEIDNSLCPTTTIHVIAIGPISTVIPYDLVLYNPPTAHPEEIEQDLKDIWYKLLDGPANFHAVWIGPNGDPGSERIKEYALKAVKVNSNIKYYDKAPRAQFLGLVRNCERFIGNSSSMFKEAPAFLKEEQIVNIGTRNRDRKFIEVRVGGSDRIHQHVRRFLGLA